MPKASERRNGQRHDEGLSGAAETAPPKTDRRSGHEGLLDVVWEALNVARENKALVMACGGTIMNINALAADLCGTSLPQLKGRAIKQLLQVPQGSSARWETTFEREGMRPIPIEVTRKSLSGELADVEIYAIRDLRERRATAGQLQRQAQLLVQQAESLKAQNQLLDAALSNMVQGKGRRTSSRERRYARSSNTELRAVCTSARPLTKCSTVCAREWHGRSRVT